MMKLSLSLLIKASASSHGRTILALGCTEPKLMHERKQCWVHEGPHTPFPEAWYCSLLHMAHMHKLLQQVLTHTKSCWAPRCHNAET